MKEDGTGEINSKPRKNWLNEYAKSVQKYEKHEKENRVFTEMIL